MCDVEVKDKEKEIKVYGGVRCKSNTLGLEWVKEEAISYRFIPEPR